MKLVIDSFHLPYNERFPLLVYSHAVESPMPNVVEKLLEKQGWKNAWIDGIYDFSHYHSNTHEVLVICEGKAEVEFGNQKRINIQKGDVVIIPAGVSHQKIKSSAEFTVVGAYPFDVKYDMCKTHDRQKQESIDQVPLPSNDPIFGKNGPIFDHWK